MELHTKFSSQTEKHAYLLFIADYQKMYWRIFNENLKSVDIYTAQAKYEKLTKLEQKKVKVKNKPVANAIYNLIHADYEGLIKDGETHPQPDAQDYEFLIGLMSNLGVITIRREIASGNYWRFYGIDQGPYEMFKNYYEEQYTLKAQQLAQLKQQSNQTDSNYLEAEK